ncbi:chloride channel protein [Leuconostoc mesenteroides]|uniref:chloride channel protein n=2 Tax=Leuconostoc mesenteroides TaxID=1245 RepID=UPI0004614FB0|nr:chloride channel protein [Leuconostoc mesenteroides]KDA52018.1 Chloride channel protein [Leuconostoc mesenteroides subsp. cremoris T26]ORI39504.1 chloride channel protein [Leuconostoc mesenteroides subsp. cremoris]ORI40223.1 chloride channel protein [Leuconostoc mesenteroides subsp. cremoris]ORI42323.1 chloride channel protein [Leuconostoc mesenteroides subsp. cremoris]ORI43756.1 chloride channel protein [Leuconostoc mesenteroides subsp. cremoris]
MKNTLQKNNVKSDQSKYQLMVLIGGTVLIGIVVGLSSFFLGLLLEYVEQLFLNYEETVWQPAPTGTIPVRRLFSVLIGSVIAAVIWWFLRTKTKPTVGITKALSGEKMPFWQTILHVMTQIFYVGTGGSVGRELAPREAGAMLAQKVGSAFEKFSLPQLSSDDRKLLIASAAGAGFAGIYIAPITGMFFCTEILLKKMTVRTVAVSLSMSTIAMLIGSIAKGFKPYYLVGDAKLSVATLLVVLVIAPLCGIAGSLFRKLCQWAEKNQTRKNNILWQLPMMGLTTGLISIIFPEVMGNGRSLAQLAINSEGFLSVSLLLLGALTKMVVTVLTIRFGAAGGTLTPAIAIGAVLGAFIGSFLLYLVPGIPMWEVVILGTATLLAASQQAPLMALFMIFEICHLNYAMLLPLGLGVLISIVISRKVLGQFN